MRHLSAVPLLLLAAPAFAQLSVTVQRPTQTQAVLQINGYLGTCTIAVSQSSSLASLHPDVNGSEYPGANTDTGRADTITQSNGTRLVTIGHMNDDRALAAATTYYVQVSGCGSTITRSFTTPTIGNGSNQQWPVPFNSSKPWNYGYPTINLTSPTWVVDPITGVQLRPLNSALDRTWRTGASPNSAPFAGLYTAFQYWAGGAAWSNAGNAVNENTSNASTTNTNPLDLYGLYTRFYSPGSADAPWHGFSYDDLGIPLWGSCTSTGAACNITLCIFTSPSAGCLGTPISVTLPGTFGQVRSSSTTDPDFPWPSNFPTAFFNGWGLAAPLGPDHVNTSGTLSCQLSVCTIPSPTQYSHFPSTMAIGQRVYIAGSSPICTNSLCTVATYQHAGQITINENYSSSSLSITTATSVNPMVLTFSGTIPTYLVSGGYLLISGATGTGCSNLNGVQQVQNVINSTSVSLYFNGAGCSYASGATAVAMNSFTALMWGLRIAKANTTGSVTVGAAFKWAGSLGIGQADATDYVCNPHGFSSGDGHFGYLCTTPAFTNQNGSSTMYFVSSDGTARSIWNNNVWPNSSCYASTKANDMPGSGQSIFVGQAAPDPVDARTFYINGSNGAGTTSLYKLVYSGDTTENLNTAYTYDQVGDGSIINAPCGHWSVTNLMPPSQSKDIVSQIAANWSGTYNTTLYGNSASTWSFSGITQGYATYNNNYGGQNNPGWIAVVNLSTGSVQNLINTLDGTGTTGYFGGIRWGGLHNVTDNLFVPAIEVTNNAPAANNPSVLFGGPFEATPLAVLAPDGVTWNTSTPLPWPIDTSYFSSCPSGNAFEFMGATGNNCVTLKFPTGGVCNIAAGGAEKSAVAPCPWNGSFTNPVQLAPGDNFVDACLSGGNCAANPGDAGDTEHFRIISVTPISGGLQVVAQRNAIFDYCSFNPTFFPGTTVNNGLDVTSQFQHSNGWTAVMMPPRLNGCNTGTFYINPSTGAIIENGRLLAGHGSLAPGLTVGNDSYIVAGASKPNLPYATVFALPTTFYTQVGPTFQGQNLGIGGGAVQSYVGTPGGTPWMVDANMLNGNFGSGPELNNNAIGNVTLTQITGSTYLISSLGATLNNVNYKLFPLIGWAGRYLLHDVSGPSSSIASSPWGICYVYNAGECTGGSTVGQLYVNAPGAFNSGVCNTGQSFLISPCVVLGFPSGGGVRQQRITSTDQTSQGSRLLSYLLTSPGEEYPFSGITASPDGSFALAAAHHTQGWTTMAWILKLPPWQEDSIDRTKFIPVPVQVPPGAQYAEIQFGYSRYIGPNGSPLSFYCTARTEACDTSGSPYNFESDTRTLTTCTNGCTISIPVMAPNLVYYRVRRSSDGVNWSAGDVQTVAKQ